MANGTTVVHVTHEAARKVGGIGAVLDGFFTCKTYLKAVERTIVIGPLFNKDDVISEQLGENGEVLYSSLDGTADTKYAPAFEEINDIYNSGIIYGRRSFTDEHTGVKSSPEIVLIDVTKMHQWPVDEFKKQLYEQFGIQCHLYEHLWEFEQYIRLAPVAIAVLKAIGAASESTIVAAHEFMGMPTALAAVYDPFCDFKTAFYAHEVATIRRIVESRPGHDTMFYNALRQAKNNNLYVTDVFGSQSDYFKHPLVEASKYCNCICAVGDYAAEELSFLSLEFKNVDIDVVYNGIPAYEIKTADKVNSKKKLQRYCRNLLGYKPDFVFTHVTRLVKSKGLWRDLSVLEHIEKEFITIGKTAVFFLLSTEVSQRSTEDILEMESLYDWPVAHRQGWPDLSGGETDFYLDIQKFNARSRNIKVVFINQFGFDRLRCGSKMPEDMEFMDIRKGTDVEFGLSIYEPFGISQLEPLTFGGICVFTNICGCAGFLRDVTHAESTRNVIIADYTNLHNTPYEGLTCAEQIDKPIREHIEDCISEKVAMQICSRLPKSEAEIASLVQTGYDLAKNMSWDVVVKNYVLPSLQKALKKKSEARTVMQSQN